MAEALTGPGDERPLYETLTGGQRAMITLAAIVALLMQVLDTTIANVAVPHMMASLSAQPDTISWVLTSYIVASAIALPITGWLSNRIGRKTLFIASTVGFTFFSVMCATATSLEQMVLYRACQGVTGAFLMPLCQSILFDINPPKKHAQAMAIFSGGMMIGPIMGPVIGGYLTDTLNWRWVFLVNLPVGAIATVMLLRFLPTTRTTRTRFDLAGFALLAIGIAALQLMLDRGSHLDWFDSWEICIETGLAVACFWMFGVHMVTVKEPLLPRRLFTDRTYLTGTTMLSVMTLVAFGALALLPQFLQNLLGYPVTLAGMLTAPRGAGTMAAMIVMSYATGKVDDRAFIVGGFCLIAASMWMMTGFALEMPRGPIIVTGLMQGFGQGIVMVPLTTIAFSNLPIMDRTNAASFLNLARSLSGSIGISIVSTMLARNIQESHADLSQHITNATIAIVPPQFGAFSQMTGAAAMMVDGEINRQATMIAYLDNFHIMMILTLAMLPMVLLLRKGAKKPGDDEHMVAME